MHKRYLLPPVIIRKNKNNLCLNTYTVNKIVRLKNEIAEDDIRTSQKLINFITLSRDKETLLVN